MAITITKQPTGRYPAFNDSYVQFTSTLPANVRAEIQIFGGVFPEPFVIYPNPSGVYTFNFKEAVKALMEEYDFADVNGATIGASDWGQSLLGITRDVNADITVYGITEASETTSISLEFFRGVKQIGESIFTNNAQILNYSTNGIDFKLTYFEGYPFSFELLDLTHSGTKDITVKNLNSGETSAQIFTQFSGAFKIIIDKGSSNWTTTSFLPLTDTINRLEVYEDDVFKSNLQLKKVPSRCGVYLKWLNSDGGYSYWLFDEFYRDNINSRITGEYATNRFANLGDVVSPTGMLGKSASRTLRLKTEVDKNEEKILESLFTSPYVEMYSAREPFQDGEWISVQLNDNYSISSKKSRNDVVVNVELPELNTITR